MNETYVECLVKGKNSILMKFLQIFLTILTVLFVMCLMVNILGLLALPLAIACGVGAYFAGMNANVEYEYLYLDKEITIDKVLNKTKRKRVGVFSVEKMEILAPLKSYHLDDYKNRQVKTFDYSCGVEKKPETRYCMYYNGEKKLILEPNEAMVKAIKNIAPRKVFMD